MANVVGGTVVWNLDVNKQQLSAGLASARQEVSKFADEADKKFSQMGKSISESFKEAERGSKMFAGAVAVVGTSLTALITKTTLTAARTETLGVAMNAVAKATSTSISELEKQEAIMKKQGIATQEARTILTNFMQSQLDVADASKLARVAQDLAVIGGENSSETAAKLTEAVANQNVLMLRQFGIVTNTTDIFDRYAETLGKSSSQLTDTEKKQAFLNQILKEGEKVAGTYEAAMETAGKKLTSLPRHIQEASNVIGTAFLPAFGGLIDLFTEFLKSVTPEAVAAVMSVIIDNGPIIAGVILGGLTPAFVALAASIWAALAPLLPFIAAGALIGVGVKLIVDALGGWTEVQKKLTSAWEAFIGVFNSFIKPALDELWKVIKEELLPQLQELWNLVSPVLIPILKAFAIVIGGVVLIALRAIIEILKFVIHWVAIAIEKFVAFVEFFKSLPEKIRGALSGLKDAITRPFEEAWKKVSEIAENIKGKMDLINPFHRNSPSLVDNITRGVGVIKDQFASLGNNISFPKVSGLAPSFENQPAFATTSGVDIGSPVTKKQDIQVNIGQVNDNRDIDIISRELGYKIAILPQ